MPLAPALPLIDIAPFLSLSADDAARRATAAALHDACLNVGFFYCAGFGELISREDMDEVLEVTRAFFERSEEEKALVKIKATGDMARGWQRIGVNVTQNKKDWHEGWDTYRPFPPDQEDPTKLLHGPNLWPVQPASFQPTIERWMAKATILGEALMAATAMALGIDVEAGEADAATLQRWMREPFWYLRCIGYPPLPHDADGLSCGAHKDYGNFTLLHSDSSRGALQVFLRDSAGPVTEEGERGHWVNADPVEGAFVVNIGDMVEVYSAGLYRATLHRVVHKSPTYRVSIPFFFEPSLDARIAPLPSALLLREELLGSTAPPMATEPVVYGDFLRAKVLSNFALEDS